MRTLGIDLGSNSLGWAVVDDAAKVIESKGVVVFPDGIDPANDTLDTPAAIRRAARMGRRMKFRRKMRKWHLLKLLIDNGMCPLTVAELKEWQKDGVYPIANHAFIAWLKSTDSSNPYCDRNAAAEGKVAPEVLGRALYHICQRRGFKSSRKDAAPDTGDEEADRKAAVKKLGRVATDIAQLTDAIRASGVKTLGQYFFRQLESQKTLPQKQRIRGRYTGRVEHYMAEFAVIMETQKISEPLRGQFYKALFMQRPLRSQSHLVGNCPLESANRRVAISHPDYEEFRMLAFVNNLSFEDQDGNRVLLSAEDRTLACSAFFRASPTLKFGDISKKFKKDPRFKSGSLRFHYYRDDETLSSCCMRHRLREAFGDIHFDEQQVFDAILFFDDDARLRGWFEKHYPALESNAIARLVAIHPREGNAAYSLKAIRKILPFLRRGFELSYAKFLAKLPDVIENYTSNEDEILRNLAEIQFRYREEKRQLAELSGRGNGKVVPLADRYRDYLLEYWNVTDDKWGQLYSSSENAYVGKVKLPTRLPAVELGMIRNPLVQRSMTTLRRLVNYLRDHGQIDGETVIRIELARNVNDYATRKAIQAWQRQREAVRERARGEIAALGVATTDDAIERYVLADEQDWQCLYTGRKIAIADLLAGNSLDIEHTVPRSLSGDDSLANKTICDAKYNRTVKQGRIPGDCPNCDEIETRLTAWRQKLDGLEKTFQSQNRSAKLAADSGMKSQLRIKALTTRLERDYWRDKLRRFDVTSDKLVAGAGGLSGFMKRQLVDTGIMCSHAVELLKSVYPNVYSVNGAATAFARKAWGLQEDEAKDRSEHTHHAKDAMVIAALTPARFNQICSALKDDAKQGVRPCDVCPAPWSGFAEGVRAAVSEILVKHVLRQTTLRQSSKRNVLAHPHREQGKPNGRLIKYVKSQGDTVRGQLHCDTFYGCIQNPMSGQQAYVVRKSLVGPLPAALALVDKIVDPAIKELVRAELSKLKAAGAKNVAAGDICMRSGVPVNKVRIVAHTTNPMVLRSHTMASSWDYKTPYYVTAASGSNFRLGLFEIDGKCSVVPDNTLDWAQNHKRDDYRPLDQWPGFVGYIMPGTMALAYGAGNGDELRKLSVKDLGARLYKVVKFESTGRITFRLHTEARASVVLAADLKAAGKHAAGESKIDLKASNELLYLSPSVYLKQMWFEGIHFKMMLDGVIKFLK